MSDRFLKEKKIEKEYKKFLLVWKMLKRAYLSLYTQISFNNFSSENCPSFRF